jgi:hypothetical protein
VYFNYFKYKILKLQIGRLHWGLQLSYRKYIYLTRYKNASIFLTWQALIRSYYGLKIYYWFFEHLNVLNWKNSKLQSCRSHRGLQFLYKVHLHPTSYEGVMNFQTFCLVTPFLVAWQNGTVTPAGVAWQRFSHRKCHLTWRTLPRQCIWCDNVIWSCWHHFLARVKMVRKG